MLMKTGQMSLLPRRQNYHPVNPSLGDSRLAQ
jgi:hypothetical protein